MDNIFTMSMLIKNSTLSVLYSANILTKIWRKSIEDTNISTVRWGLLLDRYQTRINALNPSDVKQNLKGNADARLAADSLTWSALIIGFAIVNYKDVSFTFKLNDTLSYTISSKEKPFTDTTLKELWNHILINENLTNAQYKSLMIEWKLKHYKEPKTPRTNLNLIGNTVKKLNSPTLTWPAFMTGLSILKYENIKLNVKINIKPPVEYNIDLNVVVEYM